MLREGCKCLSALLVAPGRRRTSLVTLTSASQAQIGHASGISWATTVSHLVAWQSDVNQPGLAIGARQGLWNPTDATQNSCAQPYSTLPAVSELRPRVPFSREGSENKRLKLAQQWQVAAHSCFTCPAPNVSLPSQMNAFFSVQMLSLHHTAMHFASRWLR